MEIDVEETVRSVFGVSVEDCLTEEISALGFAEESGWNLDNLADIEFGLSDDECTRHVLDSLALARNLVIGKVSASLTEEQWDHIMQGEDAALSMMEYDGPTIDTQPGEDCPPKLSGIDCSAMGITEITLASLVFAELGGVHI